MLKSSVSVPRRAYRLRGGKPIAGGVIITPPPPSIPEGTIAYTFSLDRRTRVSSGVYDASDTLRRRLLAAELKSAGSHSETWDGKDDDGIAVDPADGPFTLKLVGHNIVFEKALAANSSLQWDGPGKFARYNPPAKFLLSGNYLIAAAAYVEGGYELMVTDRSSPGSWESHETLDGSRYLQHWGCCCDDEFVYFRSPVDRQFPAYKQLEGITKVAIGTWEHGTFSGLTSDGQGWFTPPTVANINYSKKYLVVSENASASDDDYNVEAIAVQRTGNMLAVTMPQQGLVKIYHKGTGALLASLGMVNPRRLAWSPDETQLWVSDGSADVTIFAGDFGDVPGISFYDFGGVVRELSTEWGGAHVLAAIGGDVQQVVAVDAGEGTESWRLGQAGGYETNTVIASDRFHFPVANSGGVGAGSIEVDDDGYLWVFDGSLYRVSRFESPDSSGVASYTFWFSAHYHAIQHVGDPEVFYFSRFIRWQRDWAQALEPGDPNGAYTATHFYGYPFVDDASVTDPAIVAATTLGGRQYAYVYWIDGGGTIHDIIVELLDTGVRTTAVSLPGNLKQLAFKANGDIVYAGAGEVVKRAYGGLNGSNDPIYAAAATERDFPGQDDDPVQTNNFKTPFHVLADGTMIVYGSNQDADPGRYHVGALRANGTFRWRALRNVAADLPFPDNGTGPINTSANFCCGAVAAGGFVVVPCNCEFYYGGQAGNHLVFNKDGLYIGQFGQQWQGPISGIGDLLYPVFGYGGNMFGACMVVDPEDDLVRYFNTNESGDSGIQEWTFANAGSYWEEDLAGAMGSTLAFGAIAGAGDAPGALAAAAESDDFERADSGTIGNGWSDLLAYNGTSLVGGNLVVNSGLINKTRENCIYRGASDLLEVWQKIEFASPKPGYGWVSGSSIYAMFGLAARVNSVSGARIIGLAFYNRYGAGASDFSFGLAFAFFNGTDWYITSNQSVAFINEATPPDYELVMGVWGTQPTRMVLELRNKTTGERLHRIYNENWDVALESAGKYGINLTNQNQRVLRWDRFDFAMANACLPAKGW